MKCDIQDWILEQKKEKKKHLKKLVKSNEI